MAEFFSKFFSEFSFQIYLILSTSHLLNSNLKKTFFSALAGLDIRHYSTFYKTILKYVGNLYWHQLQDITHFPLEAGGFKNNAANWKCLLGRL